MEIKQFDAIEDRERKEKNMIYMDNAATTMHKPECVIEAVAAAMHSMGNAGKRCSCSIFGCIPNDLWDKRRACPFFWRGKPKTDCIHMQFYRKFKYGDQGNDQAGRSCDYNRDGA